MQKTCTYSYNESIIRIRNVVKRQYGVWKRRFPILKIDLLFKFKQFTATAVIHNMALKENEMIPEDWVEREKEENHEPIQEFPDYHPSHTIRQNIINEYFARL
ncbi:hypothetical protein Zmor_001638 [Zophobas morio]|uniref:DDE Tnp4 domain-containing protein n=1 Tax=Zophobas morio TaxID=2755281 RepID=A0AA38MPG4_9CUCU|nr:hypothetical protein Zmor_001638 [Zophobas morio]